MSSEPWAYLCGMNAAAWTFSSRYVSGEMLVLWVEKCFISNFYGKDPVRQCYIVVCNAVHLQKLADKTPAAVVSIPWRIWHIVLDVRLCTNCRSKDLNGTSIFVFDLS